MGLGVFLIANDFTALSVALPQMERDLDTDLSTVQWVINAYALVFGVLTVSGGRLADLFGRRRIFVLGAVIFALCLLLAAVAPSAALLIVARAPMAVGGALMWPATLSSCCRGAGCWPSTCRSPSRRSPSCCATSLRAEARRGTGASTSPACCS